METDTPTAPPGERSVDRDVDEDRSSSRVYQLVEVLSAVVLALATVATAWSAYQSARWGSEQTTHMQQATTAIIRASHFADLGDLGEHKRSLHTDLFGQWAAAVGTGNTPLADFLLDRFPEPLKTATVAWQATRPLSNPSAPATPFDMPDYVLAEQAEAERWEATAAAESEAANTANEHADRYLLFTIVFATVLFFGGISGKFRWLAVDIATLVLGVLALAAGVVILAASPIK
jgi:hypothetical protein